MLNIIIDFETLSRNWQEKMVDVDNTQAFSKMIKAEIYNIFSESFNNDRSYDSIAAKEKAIKWASNKKCLIKLISGNKSRSYKMSIIEFSNMLISELESAKGFPQIEENFKKKVETKSELAIARKQKEQYTTLLDAITSAEEKIKSNMKNYSNKSQASPVANELSKVAELEPELRDKIESVKKLCDSTDALTNRIKSIKRLKDINTNIPINTLVSEIDKLNSILIKDEVNKLESNKLNKFLFDALCDVVLPSQHLCSGLSPFKRKKENKGNKDLFNLSEKTIDITNKLYSIYLLNEEKLFNDSNDINRNAFESLKLDVKDFDITELNNEFELLKNKQYIGNEIFYYINDFVFLMEKINARLYVAKIRISHAKTWEMQFYLPYPAKSEKLSLARENIKIADEKIIDYRSLYLKCAEYLNFKEYTQLQNHSKALNDLIVFLYDLKKFTNNGIEMKDKYLDTLSMDSDDDQNERTRISIEMAASLNHQSRNILKSFKEYIDEYLDTEVFKDTFNQNALLTCNKIINEIDEAHVHHFINLNAIYNKLFSKDITFKSINNQKDLLSIMNEFDSHRATKN